MAYVMLVRLIPSGVATGTSTDPFDHATGGLVQFDRSTGGRSCIHGTKCHCLRYQWFSRSPTNHTTAINTTAAISRPTNFPNFPEAVISGAE